MTEARFPSCAATVPGEARRRSSAALWVDDDGSVSTTGPMDLDGVRWAT
jgi:hypothetical protein